MNSLPLPAIVAAAAAVVTLPFNLAAAGTLFLTAWLGLIIHSDYVLRRRRAPLPRHAWRRSHVYFRRLAVVRERNQLAA
jgi:hypothetical protein